MPLKLKPPSLPNPPPPDTPSSATSAKRKLTITFGSASQTTSPATDIPAAVTPASTKPKAPRKPKADKPTRTSKPTPKKRDLDVSALANDDEPKGNGLANVKRLKLSISAVSKPRPPTPPKEDSFKAVKYVRTKFKGKIPDRPIGVGYDSASSDIENDPALEEEFVLRMQPGPDCDYIRQAIADRRWGSIQEGGADVRLQFLRNDGRRAIVSVQKRLYAACLVDLPCVIEGMKSWDKKAWFKTGDICQMLLVIARIDKEEDALEYPLPKDVDPKTWQYAHGLTPPMRHARKRRFRKRISKNAIEAVEEEVERLLAQDAECIAAGGDTKYEVIDLDRLTQEQEERKEAEAETEEYDEEDAEGEEVDEDADADEDVENNYEPIVGEDDEGDDAAMEAALAAAMEDDDNIAPEPTTLGPSPQPTTTQPSIPETTTASAPAQPPPTSSSALAPTADDPPTSQPRLTSPSEPASLAATPAAQTTSLSSSPSPSSSSSEGSEDEDEDDDSSLDDAAKEQKRERERQWAEINDMKAMIRGQEEKAAAQPNAILKSKILGAVRSLRRDLGVKMASLGVEGEEDGAGDKVGEGGGREG
ncbi:MAG: hypothetical protein Q9219_004883 [cf. Caloplaca sp. 3 TL-2023]